MNPVALSASDNRRSPKKQIAVRAMPRSSKPTIFAGGSPVINAASSATRRKAGNG